MVRNRSFLFYAFFISITLLVLFASIAFCCDDSSTIAQADTGLDKIFISGLSYDMPDSKGYNISDYSPQNFLTFGKHSLGKVYLIASRIIDRGNGNFVVSPDVELHYDLSETNIYDMGNGYRISSDTANSVNGYTFSSKFQKGALIIYKDNKVVYDMRNALLAWESKDNDVLGDFIDTESQRPQSFRIILAYEIMTIANSNGWRNLLEDYSITITVSDTIAVSNNCPESFDEEYSHIYYNLDAQVYNFADKQKYDTSKYPSALVNGNLPFGYSALGAMRLIARSRKSQMKDGTHAYFVADDVYFQYWAPTAFQNGLIYGSEWELCNNSDKGCDGFSDVRIGRGTIHLERTYFDETGSVTSSIENSLLTKLNQEFYRPTQEDLSRGMLLTFRVAYEIRNTRTGEYRNILEVYRFYLFGAETNVSFHNLSVNEESFADFSDQENVAFYQQGETLQNCSVSKTGIKLSYNGMEQLHTVLYRYNDSRFLYAKDQTEFTADGKYTFVIITPDDRISRVITLFVDKSSYKEMLDRYFGGQEVYTSFIKGERVLDTSVSLPVFSLSTPLSFAGQRADKFYSPLYYAVTTASDQMPSEFISLAENPFTIADGTAGEIYTVYFSTMPNMAIAGDHTIFTMSWVFTDRDSTPSVNFNSYAEYLNTPTQKYCLKDSFLQVVCQPNGSHGRYLVIFDTTSYDKAIAFAVQLEANNVLVLDDSGSIFEYRGNIYTDSEAMLLQAAVYGNARNNVVLSHFDSGTQLLRNSVIDNILTTPIDVDTYVLPDADEAEKIITTDYFQYGNHFKFIHVADFEGQNVMAELLYAEGDNVSRIGETFNVPYNTELEAVLPVSGLYSVTETNIYGRSRSFTTSIVQGFSSIYTIYDAETLDVLAEISVADYDISLTLETGSQGAIMVAESYLDPFTVTTINGEVCVAGTLYNSNGLALSGGMYVVRATDRFDNPMRFQLLISPNDKDEVGSEQPDSTNTPETEVDTPLLPDDGQGDNLQDGDSFNNDDPMASTLPDKENDASSQARDNAHDDNLPMSTTVGIISASSIGAICLSAGLSIGIQALIKRRRAR